MCVSIFSANFVWNISYSKKNLARYDQNVYWSSCKVPVTHVRFWWNVYFRDRFSKNAQISNSTKIRLVGAELFHADRREDRRMDGDDEANLRFSQFFERA